jgi:hypothetical protein
VGALRHIGRGCAAVGALRAWAVACAPESRSFAAEGIALALASPRPNSGRGFAAEAEGSPYPSPLHAPTQVGGYAAVGALRHIGRGCAAVGALRAWAVACGPEGRG